MRIGVPKEIKNNEFRVGMTPESVAAAVAHGHEVVVEHDAGRGIGAADRDYENAGASIAGGAEAIYASADMIVKVKEPQAVERGMLRPGQILYAYLHLAPDPEQTRELVDSGAVCIAYETITGQHGGLPLLKPMSQVAGRLSMQADVTILDTNADTIERLSNHFGARARVIHSNKAILASELESADLVIGAVLIPGATTPKLVTRDMLADMKPGTVLVDVAIDQGGCFETSHPTTHAEPTFIVDGIVHYCVANMPGAVPHTSTYALNNATLPGLLAIADKGWRQALSDDPHLRDGLNVCEGKVTYRAVAEALGYSYVEAASVLQPPA